MLQQSTSKCRKLSVHICQKILPSPYTMSKRIARYIASPKIKFQAVPYTSALNAPLAIGHMIVLDGEVKAGAQR